MHPPKHHATAEDLLNSLVARPSPTRCSKCGAEFMHLETTFLSLGGKIWTLPLPVCPKCDLKEDAVPPAF